MDAGGPAASAAELFRAWAPFVARQLARLGVDPADLDDAVQEVFLVVFRRGGMSEGPASERTFLTGIALRVASNARRRRRRKPTVSDDEAIAALPARSGDPHVASEVRERLARVAEALDALRPDARLLFVLLEIEGASAEEVAGALGIPIGTVYSRAHAARRAFHAAHAAAATPREDAPGVLAALWGRLGRLRRIAPRACDGPGPRALRTGEEPVR